MLREKNYAVILDCYTDEPSGYGVRPYLGTHQIHLSQALAYKKLPHFYLTIDDLRYSSGNFLASDKRTYYRTQNADNALEIISGASTIFIIMGCFVNYEYFACVPPNSDEVYSYIKNLQGNKVLFYVMGTLDGISQEYQRSKLKGIINHVEHGNTYRYVLENYLANNANGKNDLLKPNYEELDDISAIEPPIISQLKYPIIAEIETGTGCNTPTCSFCIESVRSPKITYREPESIIKQVKALYDAGVRHFRLGRQPNFFHYQRQNISKLKQLLEGIRTNCPNIETLHIDNANIINVISPQGIEFAKLIVEFCTSGNIAPFGIESFDDTVRRETRVIGTADQVMRAIEIINTYGQEIGNDGLPKLLPGINLIYNLPGQTTKTHDINMKFLQKILDNGWMTARLYYRNMTRPTGVTFEGGPDKNLEYERFFSEVVDSFVLPNQERVYPINAIVKNNREVIEDNNYSYLRSLGTCPIRIRVKKKNLLPYSYYNARITANIGYRLVEGEIV